MRVIKPIESLGTESNRKRKFSSHHGNQDLDYGALIADFLPDETSDAATEAPPAVMPPTLFGNIEIIEIG